MERLRKARPSFSSSELLTATVLLMLPRSLSSSPALDDSLLALLVLGTQLSSVGDSSVHTFEVQVGIQVISPCTVIVELEDLASS